MMLLLQASPDNHSSPSSTVLLLTHHAMNFSFPIMVFAITWLNGVMQVSGKNIASLLTISNFPQLQA
jgi:hypothetical protein